MPSPDAASLAQPTCVRRGKVVDWAHWGGSAPAYSQTPHLTEKLPWFKTQMLGGLGVLSPKNISGNITNATAGSVFSWTGGSPTHHAINAGSALVSRGEISMTIPAAAGKAERRQLTLYIGAKNCTGLLTVTSGGKTVTRLLDPATQRDTSDDDQREYFLESDVAATVFFTGAVTVSFKMDK